jgi:predicted transcriptional regulator
MTKLVRDLMHKGLLTCRSDAPLGQVASLLAEHHIHALIVADNAGKPMGLISDFDLLAGEWLSVDNESLAAMKKLTAGDLMSAPIDTVEADVSLKDAARAMIEKEIHRLMVTEKNMPVGVISISDFVASIAQQTKAKRETVSDVMSDAFLVCRDKTPIISAARTMTQTHWRSVLVVDSKGKPQGVITGKDLLRFAGNDVREDLTVSRVMHPSLTTIDMNASLHEASDMMIKNHQHRLIVVDGNTPESFPLGIISSSDIVAEMARPGSIWQS